MPGGNIDFFRINVHQLDCRGSISRIIWPTTCGTRESSRQDVYCHDSSNWSRAARSKSRMIRLSLTLPDAASYESMELLLTQGFCLTPLMCSTWKARTGKQKEASATPESLRAHPHRTLRHPNYKEGNAWEILEKYGHLMKKNGTLFEDQFFVIGMRKRENYLLHLKPCYPNNHWQ